MNKYIVEIDDLKEVTVDETDDARIFMCMTCKTGVELTQLCMSCQGISNIFIN